MPRTHAALRCGGFSAAYYAANAVHQGYMSLFYTSLGFGSAQLGVLAACTALSGMLVQPLWGQTGDRCRRRAALTAGMAFASALLLLGALPLRSFAAQLAAAALFFSVYAALLPMGDSVVLEALRTQKKPYGLCRLAGGVSFAAAGAVFGVLLGRTNARSVPLAAALLLALTGGSALLLPEPARGAGGGRRAFRELFKNAALVRLLLLLLPLQATMGFFYTFFAPYYLSLPGARASLLGLGYLLAALCEAPYLLFSDRLFARFGAARPMCAAGLVLGLRWLTLALWPSAGAALASQALHGGGLIVLTVSMTCYVARNVPRELHASGQMLLTLTGYGAARVIGNLGGGLLAAAVGVRTVFLICAGVCLAASAGFLPWALRAHGSQDRPPYS